MLVGLTDYQIPVHYCHGLHYEQMGPVSTAGLGYLGSGRPPGAPPSLHIPVRYHGTLSRRPRGPETLEGTTMSLYKTMPGANQTPSRLRHAKSVGMSHRAIISQPSGFGIEGNETADMSRVCAPPCTAS